MSDPVDLNALAAQLSTTITQAQEAIQAITAAAQAVTAQVNHAEKLIDGIESAVAEAQKLETDADSKIVTIQIPWIFRK